MALQLLTPPSLQTLTAIFFFPFIDRYSEWKIEKRGDKQQEENKNKKLFDIWTRAGGSRYIDFFVNALLQIVAILHDSAVCVPICSLPIIFYQQPRILRKLLRSQNPEILGELVEVPIKNL